MFYIPTIDSVELMPIEAVDNQEWKLYRNLLELVEEMNTLPTAEQAMQEEPNSAPLTMLPMIF